MFTASRNTLAFAVLLLVAILCGACTAPKERTEAEGMKINAEWYTGIPWRVLEIKNQRSSLSLKAEHQVFLRVVNQKDIPSIMVFSDQHVDYDKIAALRVGDEIRFRYDATDGDPTITSGGFGMTMKYLRLDSKH